MLRRGRSLQALQVAGLLVLLGLGIFALPYRLPVTPSVSLSYVTGFNNRAAVVAFVLLGLLVAMRAQGLLPQGLARDRSLPRWTLAATMVAMLALTIMWRRHHWLDLGPEAFYALERQQHLDRGEHLYRDFEFIYGPLLIYPGHLATTLFRVSSRTGYLIALAAVYTLSSAMIWFVVAKANLPTRYRTAVLVFLFASSALSVTADGMNSVPMRLYAATALSLAVFLFWRRSRHPYQTVAVATLAIAVGFLVSPEQGFSLALGLVAYTAFLTWVDREAFPRTASVLLALGAACVVLIAWRSGLFLSMRSMAQGGLNFPLLPSWPNLLFLVTYLCGFAALVKAVRLRQVDNAIVPLSLCGTVLLTSAFGRCDQGHLAGAIPLYVGAILSIAGRPRLFFPWLAVAVYLVFPFHYLTEIALRQVHRAVHAQVAAFSASPGLQSPQATIPQRMYFAPLLMPMAPWGRSPWPVESGYYFGIWDVTSPSTIQAKADEITRRRSPQLLLPDDNHGLTVHFWPSEEDVQQLHMLEDAPWVPIAKHKLPATEPIRRAILALYRPTNEAEAGWRVWTLR